MSADGYAALRREVESGKRGAPHLLSFDHIPEDLTGFAVGLKYEDANGDITHRWVTVRSLDPYDGKIATYCWKRREARTLYLDRIIEAVDGDGQVLDGEEFIARLTGEPIETAPSASNQRSSRKERQRRETGRHEVADHIGAQRTARQQENAGKSKAKETKDMIVGLLTLAFLAWLFFF